MNNASRADINPQYELPAQQNWINLNAARDNTRVRYLRAGSGPPLLLVHGLLGY